MARPIRTLTGPKARKYLSGLLTSDPGVPPEAAERVTAALEKEVVAVKVRPVKAAAPPAPLLPFKDLPQTAPAQGPAEADESEISEGPDAAEAAERDETAPVFDPFAFSLVVVLTKQGEKGLREKLNGIASAANLKALAKAQHVSLPGNPSKTADIRAAIVAGTERRIADRKAAAS